jgi:riboflavin kinase/FMN adenylyltransferase
MRIVRNFAACPPQFKNAVVALGNFDGVHLGHRAILRHTIATAQSSDAPSAVMTFEPHPREFFNPAGGKLRIYPFRRKVKLLAEAGIDALFLVRFNRKFAAQSAQSFIEGILHENLAVRHVVTGYNFAFGHNREGNTEFLDHTAKKLGMGYSAYPPVHDAQGQAVSSSAIRGHLAAGDMAAASALLGRDYAIEGYVRHGERRGRQLGFPTANIALPRLFKPRFGIYAVRVQVDGAWLDGVASLGINPTFGVIQPLLEVHIFDTNRDLYGQYLRVEMRHYLREEARFDSLDALRAQMAEDCRQAREILHARQT